MSSSSKSKVIFVIFGFFVIAASFFLYKSNYAVANKNNGKTFGSWTVVCNDIKNDLETKNQQTNNKQQCWLIQQVYNSVKNDKGEEQKNLLATYQIGYVGKNNSLVMLQQLPLGVNLEAGNSILISKDLVAKGVYVTCLNMCTARVPISEEALKKILSNEEAGVAIMTYEGKHIVLPMKTDGLEKGLKTLRK